MAELKAESRFCSLVCIMAIVWGFLLVGLPVWVTAGGAAPVTQLASSLLEKRDRDSAQLPGGMDPMRVVRLVQRNRGSAVEGHRIREAGPDSSVGPREGLKYNREYMSRIHNRHAYDAGRPARASIPGGSNRVGARWGSVPGYNFLGAITRAEGSGSGASRAIADEVGPAFQIGAGEPVYGPAALDQYSPVVAFDGSSYLVVWEDIRNGSSYDIYGARVSREGMVLDTIGIPISVAAGDQVSPALAFDGTNYLVVWVDWRTDPLYEPHIYGARVSMGGVVLDTTGIRISIAAGDQWSPAIAFDGTNYLVVWDDYRNGGSGYDIYGARVNVGGVVLDPDGIAISTASGDQGASAIAFDGTNYLVVWDDSRNGDSYYYNLDIYGARVSVGGVVLDPNGIAIATTSGDQWSPDIASGGTNCLVVWQNLREDSLYDIYGVRVSEEGVLLDTTGIPISTAAYDHWDPTVAFDGTNYLVAWEDCRNGSSYDIWAARVSMGGSVFDPGGIVISTAPDDQFSPAMVFDGTNYFVVWEDFRNGSAYYNCDVYSARVRVSGAVLDPDGIAISMAGNSQQYPATAFDGTNYLVVWEDFRNGWYDIYAGRVSASGSVLDPGGIAISVAAGDQRVPTIAFDGTNYLVVWNDCRSGSNYDIYAARVSTSGSVLDPGGIPISTATGDKGAPAMAFDGTNYLIVWDDYRSDPPYPHIYGARVTVGGIVLDPGGFAISVAAGGQWWPAIAFDGTNYLIVWDDLSGGWFDIYGARVSVAGAVLDPGGIAISTAAGDQWYPAVAFDGTNYLVVWNDDRNTLFDIYGTRVSVGGAALDPDGIAISTGAISDSYWPPQPTIAFDGTNYLVAWQDDRSGRCEIYGARVSSAGVLLDPDGLSICAMGSDESAPCVASGPVGTMLIGYSAFTSVPYNSLRIWGSIWKGPNHFMLSERSSNELTSVETMIARQATLSGISITGDLAGTADFSDLGIVSIVSGSFAGKGFSGGSFTAILDGVPYSGVWRGMVFLDAGEGKIHLKGAISGDLVGICDGYLMESVSGSGIYDQYHATWTINRFGTNTSSGVLQLDGSVVYGDSREFSSQLSVYQAQMEGSATGYYLGPLSALLTRVCVSGQNEYEEQGFSIISYVSSMGSGAGWAYNTSCSSLEGLFEEPNYGRLSALLDRNGAPPTLSGTLEPLNLGSTPQADLRVHILGPQMVSPGQTVDYVIEYRNDGLKTAEDVILFVCLDDTLAYLNASAGAIHDEFFHTVWWNVGSVPVQAGGNLTVKVQIPWGLQWGNTLPSFAYIVNLESAGTGAYGSNLQLVGGETTACSGNLFLNGISLRPPDQDPGGWWKKYEEFARNAGAGWVPLYYSGNTAMDAWHVQLATPRTPEQQTVTATNWNGLTQPLITNHSYCNCYAYSGGTRTALTAMRLYNLRCERLVLVSPMTGLYEIGQGMEMYKWELEQIFSRGSVNEVVIYQSERDTDLPGGGLYQAKFDPNDPWLSGKNITVNPQSLDVEGKPVNIDLNEINHQSHTGLFLYVNDRLINATETSSSTTSSIAVARDPNAKYGPQGYVGAGQGLDYSIEYENEGDGIAFGVYVTDVLDQDLDSGTLTVNNGGTYDPSTRTITWMVGQVNAHEGGSVSFSANLRGDATPGTEVINFATVYFPSVPEITPTNGVVCRVPLSPPVLSCFGDTLNPDSAMASATVKCTPSVGVSYFWSPEPISGQGTPHARYDSTGTKKVVVTIMSEGCKDSCEAEIAWSELTSMVFSSASAAVEQGHVTLSWQMAFDVVISSFRIERSESPEGEFIALDLPISTSSGFRFSCTDYSVETGKTYWYEIALVGASGVERYGPIRVKVEAVPTAYTAYQSYPNPFNPVCTIRYDIPRACKVSLRVFDIGGSVVRTLVDGWREPGAYSQVWDGKGDHGRTLPSGVYFYSLKAGDFAATRKLVLLR